ncbi:YfhO family protein [Enterococcus termitis]|uniref:Copper ABC transporter permease n=1 Tax=Enterococcus termitis TaxID=332950 RepID=A0A1E5GVX5_9ENTE|nr:YfhO family protein [Enterococcus termitis]OEG16841.1 copper ABC transporter permease [Enterococcus termitis]OJG99556.1 ABC transporter permease [Enterococcus termitis]
MKKKIHAFFKENWPYMTASFFIPFFVMVIIYLSLGIYPGSSRSVMASDSFSQFSNFHASFNNVLHGKQSIFYTWNASLGLNYLSLISYYLGGLFTPLVLFFKNQNIPDALYLITLLKIGSAGLAFWVFAKNTYKIPKWGHVMLSVPYALMSFATAHSEIIMWLDAFTYLPLVVLGIHRLMDKQKPTLLFVSYLLLFISNFYMGFMIGIFSFLYFIARTLTNWKLHKKRIVSYGLTSLLAGGASMILVLPAVLDLRANGETLSQITNFKTEATAFWDIVMKNMIGVYDTTKYGSIPFIYVGLLPLIFCIFYFVTKEIPWKNKVLFGSLFVILIASFYITPLNLFWHGMHAPNMFLFRYSFLFSFLVVLLAGYGFEKFKTDDLGLLAGTTIILIAVFALAEGTKSVTSYEYIPISAFILTVVFLLLYLAGIAFYQLKKIPMHYLIILLLMLVSTEAFINTNSMLKGILDDWHYASRSLYSEPYPTIKTLVDKTKKDNDSFYRLENLDSVSSNDSINYGYSGVSLFSSIRNRHSSSYLNDLGFRARGTALNIRYQNNTLLMDSLVGIKYNISESDPLKFGFLATDKTGKFSLYENSNALPLGFLADKDIYSVKQPANDNLTSQTELFNALANQKQDYFTFYQPTIINKNNVKIEQNGSTVTYKEVQNNIAKDITWTVDVPANTQAYLSLFPTDFAQLESSTATMSVNGTSQKSQINITGQYYNLGYYDTPTTVTFTVSFYGTTAVSFMEPKVVGMDTKAFEQSVQAIQEKGADLTAKGRKVTGTVTADNDQVLLTTIPYDKGWKAYVDGKKVPVSAFKKAFVSFPVTSGEHTIKLVYLPEGFLLGAILFVVCIGSFVVYVRVINKPKLALVQPKKRRRKRK